MRKSIRFFALLLILALSMPNPVFALRQVGLEESDQTKKDLLSSLTGTFSNFASPVLKPVTIAGLEESAEEMVKGLGRSSAPITREQVEGLRFRILEEAGEAKTESLENPFYVPGENSPERLSDLIRWINAPPEARLSGIPNHQVSFDIPMRWFEAGKLDSSDPVSHAGLVAWMMGNFPIFIQGNHRTGWALMNVILLRSGVIRQPLVWRESREQEFYKTLKRLNLPEFVALIRSYIPTSAGSSEDRQDPSTITLPQLIGTHPFPVRVFLGPSREEVYVQDSTGSMRYPQMTLLGQAVKVRMGNDYAAHLDPALIYHLTTAAPKDIEQQSVPRDRKVLMKLKGLIDQAGVTSSDVAVEAAVNHLVGPFSPDGKPSYARLIGYVNKALRAEGNPRERLVFSTSISSPKEVAAFELWMVKEGDITHVFQAEVSLHDGLKVRFAVNVSKDLAEASLSMQQAYHTMRADYTWDPRFVMEFYGLGVGQATFWNGKKEVPVSVGEWLDGFDELHLYQTHQGRFSVWQQHRTGNYETLSRPESDRIWESVVGIQSLYSREEPGGIVVSQTSINAGDFVARRKPDGSWQIILIWDRGKGPMPQGADSSSIVMSSILPMAWDFGQGSSSSPLIFWGRPDMAIRAAYRAWLDHARYRSESMLFVRKRFLDLAHRVNQVAIPSLFENRDRLPYWNELGPVEQSRMLLELHNTQNALAAFLKQESFPPSAGLEEAQDVLARVRRIAAQDQLQALVRDLTQPGFTYQIVDQSLVEEFPELAVLAELHQGILIDRSNDLEETRTLVTELISRSASHVDYYGYSQRADRFKEIAERALIQVEIPPPAKLELLLAQLLSNLAGLNDPDLLEARLERLGLTLQRVASWLDQLA